MGLFKKYNTGYLKEKLHINDKPHYLSALALRSFIFILAAVRT
jgi:hypothetical protein